MAAVNTIPELEKIELIVRSLLTWGANWNGHGAAAPDAEAVEYAVRWIGTLYAETSELALPWLEPNVTATADGDVVFEWSQGGRKLTVHVGDGTAEYVQVWGADAGQEMAEGNADERDARSQLWRWLTGA